MNKRFILCHAAMAAGIFLMGFSVGGAIFRRKCDCCDKVKFSIDGDQIASGCIRDSRINLEHGHICTDEDEENKFVKVRIPDDLLNKDIHVTVKIEENIPGGPIWTPTPFSAPAEFSEEAKEVLSQYISEDDERPNKLEESEEDEAQEEFAGTERIFTVKAEGSDEEYQFRETSAGHLIKIDDKQFAFVITEDQYDENEWEFDRDTLYFFDKDRRLCDDRNEVLVNQFYYVGDALERFGEGSSDPDTVHVVNYKEGKLFEVVRDYNSYSEVVLGIDSDVFEDIGGFEFEEELSMEDES